VFVQQMKGLLYVRSIVIKSMVARTFLSRIYKIIPLTDTSQAAVTRSDSSPVSASIGVNSDHFY